MWEESEPRFILNSEEVRLRHFSTGVHKIESAVAYKLDEEDSDESKNISFQWNYNAVSVHSKTLVSSVNEKKSFLYLFPVVACV